jgi:hypothetical protein
MGGTDSMDNSNHPYVPFIKDFLSGEANLTAISETPADESVMPSFADRLRSLRQAVSSYALHGDRQVVMTQFRNLTDFSNIGWD